MTEMQRLAENIGLALLEFAGWKNEELVEASEPSDEEIRAIEEALTPVVETPDEGLFDFDKGIDVKFMPYINGTDPETGKRVLQMDIHLYGVSTWGKTTSVLEGGFNSGQFDMVASADLGEMKVFRHPSFITDKLVLMDDDSPDIERVGFYGDRNDMVFEDGILIRVGWDDVPSAAVGPVRLSLSEFSLSNSENGILLNGVANRVPHRPRNIVRDLRIPL